MILGHAPSRSDSISPSVSAASENVPVSVKSPCMGSVAVVDMVKVKGAAVVKPLWVAAALPWVIAFSLTVMVIGAPALWGSIVTQ